MTEASAILFSTINTFFPPDFDTLDSKTASVPGTIAWFCFFALFSLHLDSLSCSLHETRALRVTPASTHTTHTSRPTLPLCFLPVGVLQHFISSFFTFVPFYLVSFWNSLNYYQVFWIANSWSSQFKCIYKHSEWSLSPATLFLILPSIAHLFSCDLFQGRLNIRKSSCMPVIFPFT